jgi:hypothetical protein
LQGRDKEPWRWRRGGERNPIHGIATIAPASKKRKRERGRNRGTKEMQKERKKQSKTKEMKRETEHQRREGEISERGEAKGEEDRIRRRYMCIPNTCKVPEIGTTARCGG